MPNRTKYEKHTRFFANFLALLSLLFLNNSMTRRSYGASPATSLTISRTNAVRFERRPLVRLMRVGGWRGVTICRQYISTMDGGLNRALLSSRLRIEVGKSCAWAWAEFGEVALRRLIASWGLESSTYMTSIDATDDAGPLLDFLRHAGCVVVCFNYSHCRLIRCLWNGWIAISAEFELPYWASVDVGLRSQSRVASGRAASRDMLRDVVRASRQTELRVALGDDGHCL